MLVSNFYLFQDEYTLEVYIYNEDEDDWYVHHDYILNAPPLCLEPINFDPGTENQRGNLLAVGTMDSLINIWDLDVVNTIVPAVSLGKTKKSNRQKRDGSAQGHSDAVTALSWNRLTEHILASCGADNILILWDLEEAKPGTIITEGFVDVGFFRFFYGS